MNQDPTETGARTFLHIGDAANIAGFSPRHFRRIIKETLLRKVRIGRKVFVLGADFERWQADRKISAEIATSREIRD